MPVSDIKIDKWVRMIIHISGTNGEMQWPIDFNATLKPTAAELYTMMASFWTTNANNVKNCLNANYNVDYISAETRYAGEVNYQANYYPTQPQAGISAGEAAPSSAAIVISKKSGAVGRSYNGRMYTGGLGEAVLNHDTASSGWLTLLTTLANAIAAFRTFGTYGGNLFWAVPSRKLLILTDIAAVVINAIVDSQRRRLTGRGA